MNREMVDMTSVLTVFRVGETAGVELPLTPPNSYNPSMRIPSNYKLSSLWLGAFKTEVEASTGWRLPVIWLSKPADRAR